jgi:type VI protein secretion system component VasK
MAGTLITVTTGAGALAAAVGAAGLYWSIQVGHVLDPTAMALLVAGVVMLAIGFVAQFEHQSRRWAEEMDAQLQARRRDQQSLGIIPG